MTKDLEMLADLEKRLEDKTLYYEMSDGTRNVLLGCINMLLGARQDIRLWDPMRVLLASVAGYLAHKTLQEKEN